MSQSLNFKEFKQHMDFLYESSGNVFSKMNKHVSIPNYQDDISGPLSCDIDLETDCVHYSWRNGRIEGGSFVQYNRTHEYYIPIRAFYDDEYFEQVVQQKNKERGYNG